MLCLGGCLLVIQEEAICAIGHNKEEEAGCQCQTPAELVWWKHKIGSWWAGVSMAPPCMRIRLADVGDCVFHVDIGDHQALEGGGMHRALATW